MLVWAVVTLIYECGVVECGKGWCLLALVWRLVQRAETNPQATEVIFGGRASRRRVMLR